MRWVFGIRIVLACILATVKSNQVENHRPKWKPGGSSGSVLGEEIKCKSCSQKILVLSNCVTLGQSPALPVSMFLFVCLTRIMVPHDAVVMTRFHHVGSR